jgi:pantoate--beta-alanine ligase
VINIIHTKSEMQAEVARWRDAGLSVALVPTMGSLHEGHLSLVQQAALQADRVVVSIYVNPSQFTENEDFDKYPRTLDDDVKKLEKTGQCHAVYAPSSMYDDQHSTMVVPAGAADGLESQTRPHFFTGVATIVLKLFQHVPAHIALFGEKDFQQLSVVRQMTHNLDLQIEIIGAATVRDTHGLALSSRNHYLSADQLSIAPQLYQQLCIIAQRITQGDAQERVIADAQHALLNAGFDEVDYLEICDAFTLKPAQNNRQGPIRILAAVRLGTTRLIDNIALDQSDTLA